jgi:hypothetical protein
MPCTLLMFVGDRPAIEVKRSPIPYIDFCFRLSHSPIPACRRRD